MSSRSNARRVRAIEVCPNKYRHPTLFSAGVHSRKLRDERKEPSDRRICPYFCANSDVTGPHYHVGHNQAGGRKVVDIHYRIRIGLQVKDGELDYVGLTQDEASAIRVRGEYLTHKECKVFRAES